ncbi:MAG: hypothetical protein MAG451_01313 [Anaerolineales bacterium]|nr:hypothetical protein [Anaerolineales bacterium]
MWLGAREAMWDAEEGAYTDGGLSVYDGEGWAARTTENSSLRADSVTALAVGCEGEMWIGLGSLQDNVGAGIDRLDTAGEPHNLDNDAWQAALQSPPLTSDLVTAIAPDCSRGRTWVATMPNFTDAGIRGGGVGQYNYATQSWTAYIAASGLQSYTTDTVTGDARSIAVGPDGTAWIGTWGTTGTSREEAISQWPYVPSVVNAFRDGVWSAEVFEGDGWTSTIAVDSDGTVWAGTSRGGMDSDQDGQEDQEIGKTAGGIKLATDSSEWVSWSPANTPLASGDVDVIRVGPDGDVWIGTSGWGLMRFHPSQEPTPTSTSTPAPPDLTKTPTLTSTPTLTRTATAVPPTPTATPGRPPLHHFYVPLIAGNWTEGGIPSPTPTPPDSRPQFTCSGWCEAESLPGMRRQTVTSDKAVSDWRMRIDVWLVGMLREEAPTHAVVEAPDGYHVRVEALFAGEWLLACESDAECP